MDRTDPTNFDSLAHERRTTVRGLGVEHFPDGENPWARGHEFKLNFHVGPSTDYAITANAAELRRWSMILAEAALRLAPEGEMCPECGVTVGAHDGYVDVHELDGETCEGSGFDAEGPTCPACRGDVHVDLAGAVWSTTAAAADRARALHRPVEYRPGDHYANYGPPQFHRRGKPKPPAPPEVVTVCEACQAVADDLLGRESGGFGSYEVVEYPCPTIRAMDGEGE